MPGEALGQEQVASSSVDVCDAAVPDAVKRIQSIEPGPLLPLPPCELDAAGGSRRLSELLAQETKVAAACGNGDPTAVGVGDVVEKKKVSRAPTNERSSDIVGHRLDLDVAGRESRGEEQESVTGFLSVEVGDGPGNESVARVGLWFAVIHNAL